MNNLRKVKLTVAFLFVFAGLYLISMLVAEGGGPTEKAGDNNTMSAPPPKSLAYYYPPKASGLQYTYDMLDLARLMGAVISDLRREDFANAEKSLKEFKALYTKIRDYVPEWKEMWKMGPLDQCEKLLKEKSPVNKIREATSALEKVCTDCHIQTMFRVQAKYHWPEFAMVSMAGETGRRVSFHENMLDLASDLAAVERNFNLKKFKEAYADYDKLRSDFTLLEISCQFCHTELRSYYIDKKIKAKLLLIGGVLRDYTSEKSEEKKEIDTRDARKVSANIQGIYTKSCLPCHQIHMPAAFLQLYWARKQNGK